MPKDKITLKNDIAPLDQLIPHEEVRSNNLSAVKESIRKVQSITMPIIIDQHTMVIIDGHHRYHVAKELNLKLFPVVLIDYQDSRIIALKENASGEKLNKKLVIEQALRGELLPYKSTYHGIKSENGKTKHISSILNAINVPLNQLT